MDQKLLEQKLSIVNNKDFVLDLIAKLNISDNDKTIGVAYWNSPVVYYTIKKLYPDKEVYYIEDNEIAGLYGIPAKYSIYIDVEKEYFPNMKFDKIIMNPPYDGSLHLKVLEKAFKHINTNGKVVSIQPVRWLQDPLIAYKQGTDYIKFENSISKHIESLDIYPAREAQLLFDTVFSTDLGIYILTNKGGYDYTLLKSNSILDKVVPYIVNNKCNFDANKKDGWRIRFPYMTGGKSNGSGNRKAALHNFGKLLYFYDGLKDGEPWYKFYRTNQWSKTTDTITRSIKVDSEQIAINFIKQFDTNFVKFITDSLLTDVHVREEQCIFMNSAINPRTGLKGYESEWLDEDFYNFFNITEEEQKQIEEYIGQYE